MKHLATLVLAHSFLAHTGLGAPSSVVINADHIAPVYSMSYGPARAADIKAELDRVLAYLEEASPLRIVDTDTGAVVTDWDHLPPHTDLADGTFKLTSYEWGVTYAGMLHVGEITGDTRYHDYAASRLIAIARLADHLGAAPPLAPGESSRDREITMRKVRAPHALDDAGAMGAVMIKASRAGINPTELRPCIDRYLAWISRGQMRLVDGTFSRDRPYPDSLWLDDLYMSVPALAQMGVFTGDARYFDDAVRQVRQFSDRLFDPVTGFYAHGWVGDMEPHPVFRWARANGWAAMAMAELLSVLPEDHPGRADVLRLFRAQMRGLAAVQSGTGLWHQLLDRNDSYLETSASAMFCYALARGINRGWLNPRAYGPVATLAWQALAQKINAQGQIEGTCVGTGLAFDPAFYYSRPVSVYAAHSYGPMLLAGAEMIELARHRGATAAISNGSVRFDPESQSQ